jgi:uncharacterized protein YutE (UPF0331/DUF86 family)
MVKSEVIRKRLNKLDENLKILEGIKKYTFEEFISDPEHYGSAERFLQLSIEILNDIGNHIIADEELGMINWQSDIPEILYKKKYISNEMKSNWIQIIGFRNILVHDYLDIDRKIVFSVLQNNLSDIYELRKVFSKFL